MIFPRKALSLALSGLITASCLATVAAPAEAAVPSRVNQNYTYGQVTSQYHIYNESTVNRNKPVGIVFFFNGDYYQKYANDTYISYPYRAPLTSLADVALEKNMIFVAVDTPDKSVADGGYTWWAPDGSRDFYGDWFRSFANSIIGNQGVDRSRVWTIGHSGGAEFETLELGADRQSTWRSGGGSVMVGGGTSYGMQTFPDAQAKAVSYQWFANASDTYGATDPTDWSALESGKAGQLDYQNNGFTNTKHWTLSGKGHMDYDFAAILRSAYNNAGVTNPWWYNVNGGIAAYYNSHGASAKFGLARTAEMKLRDGGVSQQFSNNYDIYWTPSWGAYSVWWGGAIGAKYRADGYENAYGFPVSDEYSINYGGSLQRFRKANGQQYGIYWSSATGAHVLKEFGDINAAYAAHQWERGWGFPSTDETGFWWGSKQHFLNTQTGARTVAYWSAETGTHTINEKGSIFAKWASLGDAGNLGFPTTDEGVFWNGSSQHYYNKKTGSRTAIYWSAATGAHTMNEKGAIYAKWASLGAVKALGFPTTDEYTDASGTVHVKFQKGEITWTASGDTKVVYSK